jgi:hypothetical protein
MHRHDSNTCRRVLIGGTIAALASSLTLLAAAEAQQPTGPATAVIRQPTPAEVKARLDAEAAAIAAEPAFEGFDKPLSHYIRATLPDWAPLGQTDSAMTEAKDFICSGDFDGNGLKDTAAVLKQRSTGVYRVMAFHQVTVTTNPGNFTHAGYDAYQVAEALPDASPYELTIACHGPGTFESVDGDMTLTLRNDSIEYADSEYYFSNGQYRSLIIGD